jgi:APA family basic amino acid/polyamine antiporter
MNSSAHEIAHEIARDSANGFKRHLVRSLGLKEAFALVVGTVIGTGVFLKAAVMSQTTGSPYWVLAAWAAAGILSFLGALCYAELGSLFPKAGGEYIFLREAYGDFAGFLFGWMRFWIATPGSIAAYGVGVATFLGAIVEYESPAGKDLIALSCIVVFSGINCFAVLVGGRMQAMLTAFKITIIVALTGAIFLGGAGGSFEHLIPVGTGDFRGWSAFGTAMLAALWAYDGWSNMPMAAGEIENPERNIPKALSIGMIVVFFIYAAANLSYFYALPFGEVLSAYSPEHREGLPIATKAVQALFGPTAVGVLTIAFVVSALGAMNGSILTGARIPYAMARDGLFFHRLGEIGKRSRAPVIAVLVQAFIACVLALSGTFDQLTNYVVFASWIFYALATGALFVFRVRRPELSRPYRVPGYPVVPAIFLLASILLLGNTLVTSPLESVIGLGFILSGVPVYFLFKRGKKMKNRE